MCRLRRALAVELPPDLAGAVEDLRDLLLEMTTAILGARDASPSTVVRKRAITTPTKRTDSPSNCGWIRI